MKQSFHFICLSLLTVLLTLSASGQYFDKSSNSLILYTILIDSLKIGSTYELQINSQGCYTSDTLLIKTFRENTGYYVSVTRSSTSIHSDGIIDTKHYERNRLSPGQLNSLRKLEKDLAAEVALMYVTGIEITNSECRFIVEYRIDLDNKRKKYVDESCRINGLQRLYKIFLPEEEKNILLP